MKIVIVDDSVVFRMALKQALGDVEGIQVVNAFSNGQLCVDYLKSGNQVDLITLDMEMPVLDGTATINKIREFNKKIPIIVFSSLTTRGAEKTLEALNSGANDFVTKEEAGGATSLEGSIEMIKQSLVPKIKAFKKVVPASEENTPSPVSEPQKVTPVVPAPVEATDDSKVNRLPEMTRKPRLIVMASSTGGPEALTNVFKALEKRNNNLPILLVQHMPPVFTTKLAEMLTRVSPGYEVIEAKGGETLNPGVCYLAPGDYHMRLNKDGVITLDQEEKVCFVRPAANCLFDSVANNYEQQVASFVLTGMGDDGGQGVISLSEKGSYNFYQSKRTCTVFGMPGAIQRTGKGNEVDLLKIPEIINDINSRI